MLAQLPPLGFPGSLTIFLLSPISSACKCSNREARDVEIEVRVCRGERVYAAWVVKVKQETECTLCHLVGSPLS